MLICEKHELWTQVWVSTQILSLIRKFVSVDSDFFSYIGDNKIYLSGHGYCVRFMCKVPSIAAGTKLAGNVNSLLPSESTII